VPKRPVYFQCRWLRLCRCCTKLILRKASRPHNAVLLTIVFRFAAGPIHATFTKVFPPQSLLTHRDGISHCAPPGFCPFVSSTLPCLVLLDAEVKNGASRARVHRDHRGTTSIFAAPTCAPIGNHRNRNPFLPPHRTGAIQIRSRYPSGPRGQEYFNPLHRQPLPRASLNSPCLPWSRVRRDEHSKPSVDLILSSTPLPLL